MTTTTVAPWTPPADWRLTEALNCLSVAAGWSEARPKDMRLIEDAVGLVSSAHDLDAALRVLTQCAARLGSVHARLEAADALANIAAHAALHPTA